MYKLHIDEVDSIWEKDEAQMLNCQARHYFRDFRRIYVLCLTDVAAMQHQSGSALRSDLIEECIDACKEMSRTCTYTETLLNLGDLGDLGGPGGLV